MALVVWVADCRSNQQHHVHPVPGRDVLDWVWWAHRSPILLLAQIVAHNIINLDFLASKLIRNFPSRLYELSLHWDWLQLCGVCVFYCRCCKFDRLLIVQWRNIFVYSRWRESKRRLLLGLNSLAENFLESDTFCQRDPVHLASMHRQSRNQALIIETLCKVY